MTTRLQARIHQPPALYDRDIVAWAEEQAHLLRAGRLAELDIEHLAEEIEDLGKSEQRALASRLSVLLAHLSTEMAIPTAAAGHQLAAHHPRPAALARVATQAHPKPESGSARSRVAGRDLAGCDQRRHRRDRARQLWAGRGIRPVRKVFSDAQPGWGPCV